MELVHLPIDRGVNFNLEETAPKHLALQRRRIVLGNDPAVIDNGDAVGQ